MCLSRPGAPEPTVEFTCLHKTQPLPCPFSSLSFCADTVFFHTPRGKHTVYQTSPLSFHGIANPYRCFKKSSLQVSRMCNTTFFLFSLPFSIGWYFHFTLRVFPLVLAVWEPLDPPHCVKEEDGPCDLEISMFFLHCTFMGQPHRSQMQPDVTLCPCLPAFAGASAMKATDAFYSNSSVKTGVFKGLLWTQTLVRNPKSTHLSFNLCPFCCKLPFSRTTEHSGKYNLYQLSLLWP